MLEFHVPSRAEFHVRQAWLADPEMMAYNARWNVSYPGCDPITGCINWPETEWSAFEARLQRPVERQGYFYVLDTAMGTFIGHAHYEVGSENAANIGINVIPSMRGMGLGERVLRLLVDRIWRDTDADQIVNDFEDDRGAALRTHQRCGFVPDPDTRDSWGRPTRTWRLHRTSN